MLLAASWDSLIQLLGVLLIFVFVLLITYLVTRWIGGFQKMQMTGRSLQVIDTVQIAAGKYIQILKIGDVYLVVAVGKDTVTMLAKLTEDEIGLTEEQIRGGARPTVFSGDVKESFQETLNRMRGRFSGKQD